MTPARVADIGEFELISILEAALPVRAKRSDRITVPMGDDAAVASLTSGEKLVISTDTLTEGVHFRLDWTSWESLGHKALAVNFSDLAAMGAIPILATVALSLTGDELVADLERMYRGMGNYSASNNAVVAGGDITKTPGPFSITITAVGETRSGLMLQRNAAIPDDLIWVTGMIGAAAAGLEIELMEETDPRKNAASADLLRDALHEPMPRIAGGRLLSGIGVRCAMDLSDGLTADLQKILVASGVDAELSIPDLPIFAAVTALFGETATDLALFGGEDYELLFTAPQDLAPQISEGLELLGVHPSVIGQIRPQFGPRPRIVGLERHGQRNEIVPRGFDHFRHQ